MVTVAKGKEGRWWKKGWNGGICGKNIMEMCRLGVVRILRKMEHWWGLANVHQPPYFTLRRGVWGFVGGNGRGLFLPTTALKIINPRTLWSRTGYTYLLKGNQSPLAHQSCHMEDCPSSQSQNRLHKMIKKCRPAGIWRWFKQFCLKAIIRMHFIDYKRKFEGTFVKITNNNIDIK